MLKLQTIIGDITQIKSDIIVNSASRFLLGGGGVDGAIHRAAGPELLAECRKLNGCEIGKSKVTKAYNLPAKYVIHACGPIYNPRDPEESERLLVSVYNSILEEASKLPNNKIITIPAISCGIFAFPIERATEIAVKTIKSWVNENQNVFENIIFVLFDENLKRIYDEELRRCIDRITI